VIRFDPTGKEQLRTTLLGSDCYNYSDWNAIVLKTVTSNNAQAGTWTRDFDSGNAMTAWLSSTWDAMTTPGVTSVSATFTAAAAQADLGDVMKSTTCGPYYQQPVDLTARPFGKKQWLRATINLNTSDVNVRPTLDNFKVWFQN
jgi:hypothetical protein